MFFQRVEELVSAAEMYFLYSIKDKNDQDTSDFTINIKHSYLLSEKTCPNSEERWQHNAEHMIT